MNNEEKYKDAIERMVAILELIADENEREDIIRQVIEIGNRAIENNDGQ